ncbi:MAG: hypothetical protein QNJ49_05190 [Mastigocoleus sp. MO_167.B18]|nr:hypothetical protein [Mastigocoleus sp. MO_188.B34]MDJ0697988.1 hypothetical protein [Mastigocoleus sp. MO_188.B34]MDJ0772814.1 hypothetical protein [Mastigocoleus sp. MO_167.B18]
MFFVYEFLPSREASLSPLAICFLGGGAIGIVVAGILEYDVLKS